MSANTVITVENLGKRYNIGQQRSKDDGIRHLIEDAVRTPLRWLRSRRAETKPRSEEFWALKDVSFEVKQGDVVGIIGRNGAGKSTLLKILSRITEPTRGRIQIDGRVACLLEVGTGFHPELTGRENIFLNGAILGMTKVEIKKKFDEIVAFSEIEKFLDTPVKRYSSGMYVRLAFAVAAHLEPEILVVDEVLAVGDVEFQKKCLGKMHDVAGQGRTVIFVSHNMAAVRQLTQKAILINKGSVLYTGLTQDAVERYEQMDVDSHEGVYDCDNLHRPNCELTGAVRFTALQFHPSQYQTFRYDENISFLARLRAERDASKFRMSLTIYRSDDTPVGSVFGAESLCMSAGEDLELTMTVPNPRLAPGHYHIATAIGTGNHTTGLKEFDIVLDVLHFEVLAPEGVDGTLASWAPAWGPIRFPELICHSPNHSECLISVK
jgi:lipopolysaccharide transport system ATP-binding protein